VVFLLGVVVVGMRDSLLLLCEARQLIMVAASLSRIFLTLFQPSTTFMPIEPSAFCSQYSMTKPPYSNVTPLAIRPSVHRKWP